MSKKKRTVVIPESKDIGYRLLATIFFIACVVILLVIPIGTFREGWVIKQDSLIKTLQLIFSSDAKACGVLPALFAPDDCVTALIATATLYIFTLCLVAAAIIAFVAAWSKKRAPRRIRTAAFVFSFGSVAYALSTICVTIYLGVNVDYDLFSAILAITGIVLCFVLMIATLGPEALIRAVQFLLSFLVSVLLIYAIINDREAITQTLAESAAFKWILLSILGFTVINLIIASFRTLTNKGLKFDMVRYLIQLVVSLLASYVSYAEGFYGSLYLVLVVLAALISILQMVITNLQFEHHSKNQVEEAKEETLSEFEKEQYVEAYIYDGGPVASVEMAEEVNLTAAAASGERPELASLVGNGFDAFLFTLGNQEKSEFIDLYILRSRCLMPEIPAYVVGGDNREFFNKVFIYLGQYREKISNGLLQKMYDFSMKLH